MILADTNVWIKYFSGGLPEMESLLLEQAICCHPCVVAELSLGKLGKYRESIMALLMNLNSLKEFPLLDIVGFIQEQELYEKGIGLIDVHLLYACLVHKATLWTFDKKLSLSAKHYKIAYSQ